MRIIGKASEQERRRLGYAIHSAYSDIELPDGTIYEDAFLGHVETFVVKYGSWKEYENGKRSYSYTAAQITNNRSSLK